METLSEGKAQGLGYRPIRRGAPRPSTHKHFDNQWAPALDDSPAASAGAGSDRGVQRKAQFASAEEGSQTGSQQHHGESHPQEAQLSSADQGEVDLLLKWTGWVMFLQFYRYISIFCVCLQKFCDGNYMKWEEDLYFNAFVSKLRDSQGNTIVLQENTIALKVFFFFKCQNVYWLNWPVQTIKISI